ncbi:antibiotic biosynthesis monooxygenase [Acinetobacter gyllenbergii]|uniref:putative quinol monooxygenase n=1 Tax=Acinetobacter gyllenbergii TaxID=134534 RepID=UPI0021D2C9B7|nr:putative quinol monooxygenase [Acinetobacter gyllenbergii]MCU4582558.1 antibiotic biosynthesis monooxygenase [Acinetobacter gyllenbergii]
MILKLIAEDYIQPDKINEVLPLYQELIEKTRTEAGCIAYDLYHDHKQTGHFVFIEEWIDREALGLHVQSEHFQRLVPQIDQYQIQAGRFTHLHRFETLLSDKE